MSDPDYDSMSVEELQKIASGSADPEFDSMSEDELQRIASGKPKHSQVAAAGMHGLQGLTGGFMDEIQGLGEAAGRLVGVKGAGGPMKDMGLSEHGPTLDWETLRDAYRLARDRERSTLNEQSKEHPKTALAGEVAGMVASPINKIAKGVSLAKGGAAIGGINALGNSEKEDLPGMAIDTAIGTGAGLVLGKGLEKASPYIEKGVQKTSRGARDLAERFGARALGAERGTIKSIGFDKVKSAAGQAIDEGVFSPLASTDDIVARNAAVKSRGGEMMGKAYGAIDDAGESTFNPQNVAEKMNEELGGFWRSPLNKGEASQFDNTLEAILARGDGNIPLREAQLLKEELGRAANWKNKLQISPKEQMARDAYQLVNKSIDDAVASGTTAVNKAGLSETLSKGKELYGKASTADKLLENKLAREQGNKLVGLTDAVTGAGALGYGGTTGDWETAGGVMLAKKGLEKYGAQNAAIGLNKLSKMLMRSPKLAELAQKNPQAFNALAENIGKRIGGGSAFPKAAGPVSPEVDDEKAKQSFIDGN